MAPKANDLQVKGTHYKTKIEHWDYVVANEIPYLEAQVIKYLTRWRKKNGHDDLRKAQHFLQKLLETEGIDWDQEVAKSRPSADRLQPEGTGENCVPGDIVSATSAGPFVLAEPAPAGEYCRWCGGEKN